MTVVVRFNNERTDMTTHETIARELAADPKTPTVHARASARQGDVILSRIGDAAGTGTALSSVLVGAGSHGEHHAIGRGVTLRDGVLSAPDGALVVHTDVPDARHTAIHLAPGAWRVDCEQELGVDNIVQKVKD